MPRHYYYLVAGLPDITLEGNRNVPSQQEFLDDVIPQVDPDDAALLKLLRLPYDNRNLINLLEKTGAELDPRGNYTREQLEEEIKVPERVPPYMVTFIEAHKEGRSLFGGLGLEDQLNRLFYEEMTAHPNEFIRKWFDFERNLRNVLVGLNSRRLAEAAGEGSPYDLQRTVVGGNDIAESILRSNAPDFSLGSMFPYVERIGSLDMGQLEEFERGIDLLRWDVLDELTIFTYFQIETILAYCAKLGMVDRWQRLDPDAGKQRLEHLVKELESEFELSEAIE